MNTITPQQLDTHVAAHRRNLRAEVAAARRASRSGRNRARLLRQRLALLHRSTVRLQAVRAAPAEHEALTSQRILRACAATTRRGAVAGSVSAALIGGVIAALLSEGRVRPLPTVAWTIILAAMVVPTQLVASRSRRQRARWRQLSRR